LEVINVIFIVSGISLVVTGAVFSYEAMAIPGPLGPAAIGAIIVGIVMVIMGAFGYKAARDRKIEGKEFKGKCELMVYAAVVFVMFSALFIVSVVLFVWLGDGIPIPETGAKDVDSLTLSGVEAAQKPVTNLVGVCTTHVVSIQSRMQRRRLRYQT
jgi:amino acid transporter